MSSWGCGPRVDRDGRLPWRLCGDLLVGVFRGEGAVLVLLRTKTGEDSSIDLLFRMVLLGIGESVAVVTRSAWTVAAGSEIEKNFMVVCLFVCLFWMDVFVELSLVRRPGFYGSQVFEQVLKKIIIEVGPKCTHCVLRVQQTVRTGTRWRFDRKANLPGEGTVIARTKSIHHCDPVVTALYHHAVIHRPKNIQENDFHS